MASDQENWIKDDASQWDEEARKTSNLKHPRATTATHTMDIIGHVAHATVTHNRKKDFEPDERDPFIRKYEAMAGKPEDWLANRKKNGRRRQQVIL